MIDYLTKRKYPTNLTREERIMFQHQVAPYTLIQGVLFKVGADDQLRRCLQKCERKQVITALHSGPSGGHFAAITTVNRIRTAGYWWPYLIRDVKAYIRKCDQCQRTGAPSFRNHWPLTPYCTTCTFLRKWGIDFIGPINPVSAQEEEVHHFGNGLCY